MDTYPCQTLLAKAEHIVGTGDQHPVCVCVCVIETKIKIETRKKFKPLDQSNLMIP